MALIIRLPQLSLWLLLGGLLATVACGRSTPTRPTPVVMPTAISISSPDTTVLVGSILQLSAIGTFEDGISRPIAPRWTVDNPAIAVIDAEGRLRGASNGVVTVVAVLEERSASKEIRVLPDYRGVWIGPLRQTSCANYDFRTCGRSYPFTNVLELRLALHQSGAGIEGLFELTRMPLPGAFFQCCNTRDDAEVSGTIQNDGTLILGGTIVRGSSTGVALERWRSSLRANDTLVGGFAYFRQIYFEVQPLVVEYELLELRRTSGT